MSDLHLGTIKNEKFLKKISTKINNLNPDIVLITGDLIDGTAPLSDNIIKKIDKIKSPIYYVIGNHEIYDGLERIIKIISKTKIKPLRDKAISFKGLQIIGLDYLEGVKLEDNLLETKLSRIKLNKNKPSILLYHSPLNINKLNDLGIDLQLAGHTHGGQIFPFHLLVRLAFRNYRGLHKFKRTTQYISEGTGTWGPTMRVLSSSEIALINLY
jgi:predicted MPP superfamily phosphohydrolase